MKATGIVRRIDDLGRVVIPKEIRRTMRIREGDPLEIYTDREGEVIFKKYSPIGELAGFAAEYAETLHKVCGISVLIFDRDAVIASAGVAKREYLDKKMSEELEEIAEHRQLYVRRAHPGDPRWRHTLFKLCHAYHHRGRHDRLCLHRNHRRGARNARNFSRIRGEAHSNGGRVFKQANGKLKKDPFSKENGSFILKHRDQMLDQNFSAERNQNDAAHDFRFRAKALAYLCADCRADKAKEKGNAADEGKCKCDSLFCTDGKRNSCRHSINAGCNRKAEHNARRERSVLFRFLTAGAGISLLDRLDDHFYTEEDE